MLCAAMVYAPFALGSIPPVAITLLVTWLFVSSGLWAVDCIQERRLPRFSWTLLVPAGWVLTLGWFMTWNAYATSLPLSSVSTPIAPHLPLAPGSENQAVSLLAMLRLTAMLSTVFVTADLARNPLWRGRFLYALAFTGAGIALFGLVQQAGLVTLIARKMNSYEGAYFSTFNYHANAGAYLNLALAPLCVLCVASFLAPQAQQRKAVATALLLLVVAATLTNTSRGAQAITLGLLLTLGSWGAWRLLAKSPGMAKYRRMILPAVLGVILLAFSAILLRYGRDAEKWRQLPAQLTEDSSRWQVWRVTVPMAMEGGAFGHGPGTFKMLLPRSPLLTNALYSRWIIQQHVPGTKISMWSMAHDDYLQTWVEFGWVGAILCGVLFFGGIVQGFGRMWRLSGASPGPQDYSWLGIVAALIGVAIHATFDFPLQVASLQVTVAVLLGMCWSPSPPSISGAGKGSKGAAAPEWAAIGKALKSLKAKIPLPRQGRAYCCDLRIRPQIRRNEGRNRWAVPAYSEDHGASSPARTRMAAPAYSTGREEWFQARTRRGATASREGWECPAPDC